MRILVASHHHPEIVTGGAGRAAYSLFQRLRSDPRIEFAAFLASAPVDSIGHSAPFGSFRGRSDEILLALPVLDGFTLETTDFDELKRRILDIVHHFRPDVVHMHHVLDWGIEAIEIFAQAGVRVVLTLHEFILICHRNGQMLRTSGELCLAASPAECSRCFPKLSPGKFFVRASLLRHFLGHVSTVVSPSHFLKARFVAWGVPTERIEVIENLLSQEFINPAADHTPRARMMKRRTVFAFFGQITPFKGVDVLLRAYGLLPESIKNLVEVRIHGENKYWRGGEFQRRIDALLDEAKDGVRVLGTYRNDDVVRMMEECDWIVVPSLWWENSPVVIQEAKLAGVRIICSDIGGMAEKTDLGIDLRFPAGNAAALAGLIEEIATSQLVPGPGESMTARRGAVAAAQKSALDAHIALYTSVLQDSRVGRQDASAKYMVAAPPRVERRAQREIASTTVARQPLT